MFSNGDGRNDTYQIHGLDDVYSRSHCARMLGNLDISTVVDGVPGLGANALAWQLYFSLRKVNEYDEN